MSEQDQQKLFMLLKAYRDCFATDLAELGCNKALHMEIHEIEGSTPVKFKAYKTSRAEREAIREVISEWKKTGIASETRSPYGSPVILISQKGGRKTLVVDYRRLNKQTKRQHYSLPNMNDLESLCKGKLFVQLDLASECFQIPLNEEAQLKSAFITPDEIDQFLKMQFGLAKAPSEFQHLMDHVMGILKDDLIKDYLNDWVIEAEDWNDMLQKTEKVLKCLREAHLTLKPSKCAFGTA